jgi:flavin reductase (DIM6/NTAB) family NADH-FMN oxidoreductase RutF
MAAKKHSDNASSDIDPMALRNALGSFATGITVVTALGKDGQRVGMTANSFNSVSLSPALVLWSIDKASNCFDDFIQAEHYAIHVLSADQQFISDQFAKSGGDKFAGLECTETPECQYCLNAALILNVGSRTNMMVEIMLFWLAALPILLTQGQSLSYFIVVTIKNCKSRNQLSV